MASPFQAQCEISPGKTDGLRCTTAGFTQVSFDREGFAVSRQLALDRRAFYPISVRRLTSSLRASFSTALAGHTLRFTSLPAVRSREDFHLQVISHAGHTKNGPRSKGTGPEQDS